MVIELSVDGDASVVGSRIDEVEVDTSGEGNGGDGSSNGHSNGDGGGIGDELRDVNEQEHNRNLSLQTGDVGSINGNAPIQGARPGHETVMNYWEHNEPNMNSISPRQGGALGRLAERRAEERRWRMQEAEG